MALIFNGIPFLDDYLFTNVTVSRNVITSDKGRTLLLTNGVVLTFPSNLWKGMGFNVVPPATGTATLRVNGTLLNYGTKDIILTSGPGLYFNQVLQININSYLISGK